MDERSEYAFFDLEATRPTRRGQGRAIVEFGVILVCPWKLEELEKYSSLVRPADWSHISSLSGYNGITQEAVLSAPFFAEIADYVFDLLDGRIWAGHNIIRFDCKLIREAFFEINRSPPEPKRIIDSYILLTQRFGRRAGDMKMASLAKYFRLGRQIHRSIDDVRMNISVLKHCATVLFLESSLLGELDTTRSESSEGYIEFLEPNEICIPDISASLVRLRRGIPMIELLHKDFTLQLHSRLRVRLEVHEKFQNLSFVVDVDPTLCRVLDECDGVVQKMSLDCGSSSEWHSVVVRKNGFRDPTARLRIPTVVNEGVACYATEMYQRKASGPEQKLVFSKVDVAELARFFKPGTFVDAYFSLDPYDYLQKAGIRLVAQKLVIQSE